MPSVTIQPGQVYRLPTEARLIVVAPTTDPLIWYTRAAASNDGVFTAIGDDVSITTQASLRTGEYLGMGTFSLPEGWVNAIPAPVEEVQIDPPRPARRVSAADAHATAFEDPGETGSGMAAAVTQRCPACQVEFTGVLGRDHQCARIMEVRCAHCRAVDVNLLAIPGTHRFLCSSCLSTGRVLCERCDNIFSQNNAEVMCSNCDPYQTDGDTPHALLASGGMPVGNGLIAKARSHRPFGVELETYQAEAGRGLSHPEIFQRKNDGSIRPERSGQATVEFYSYPLRGDLGLAKLEAAVKRIRENGYRANNSCGFHVHIDAADMDEEDLKSLAKFGFWYQDELMKLVAPSRRSAAAGGPPNGNQYCKPMSSGSLSSDRYMWFNLSPSFRKHRTVEVRLHHGITLPDRVVAWTALCLRFVEVGLKVGRSQRKPATGLMELLDLGASQTRYWNRVSAMAWRTQTPSAPPASGSI